jgi:hypothetical protein
VFVLQIAGIPLQETLESNLSKSIASIGNKAEIIDEEYLARMGQSGTWGDGIVLAMACRLYKRIVEVRMADGRVTLFSTEQQSVEGALGADDKPLCLGYVKSIGSSTKNHYVYLQKKHQSTPKTSPVTGKVLCNMTISFQYCILLFSII